MVLFLSAGNNLPETKNTLTTVTLKLTGQHQDQVFNSRCGRASACRAIALITKTAYLKVENSAETTFRLSPVSFCAPGLIFPTILDEKKSNDVVTSSFFLALASVSFCWVVAKSSRRSRSWRCSFRARSWLASSLFLFKKWGEVKPGNPCWRARLNPGTLVEGQGSLQLTSFFKLVGISSFLYWKYCSHFSLNKLH